MSDPDWASIVTGDAEEDIRVGRAVRELKENLPPDARWVQITFTDAAGDTGPEAEWEVSVEGPYHCGEVDWTHMSRSSSLADAANAVTSRLKVTE